MMIRYTAVLAIVFMGAFGPVPASAASAGEAAFFQNLNDIPLMPGLYEIPQDGVVFDKAEGRIIEAKAAAEGLQATDIQSFYARTLPQLGWKKATHNSYIRQKELLKIDVRAEGAASILTLSVSPVE